MDGVGRQVALGQPFILLISFHSVDISKGFTTNLLFRQPRKIAILVATPSFGNSSYTSLATRKDARRAVVFTYLNRDMELSDEIMTQFKIESRKTPQILLLDKTNVHQLLLNSSMTSDRIWEWIQTRNDEEATKELSVKDPHPLRLLQKAQVDTVFGVQNTMILPDESFYRVPEVNIPPHHPTIGGESGGGCPFMMGHGLGGAVHEEL